MTFNAYVAKKKCGCTVAACVDRPEYTDPTARDVVDWIKRGYTVERIEVSDEKRLQIERCEHDIQEPE